MQRHDEAADALRVVAALRAGAAERPVIDERIGEPVRHLFIASRPSPSRAPQTC